MRPNKILLETALMLSVFAPGLAARAAGPATSEPIINPVVINGGVANSIAASSSSNCDRQTREGHPCVVKDVYPEPVTPGMVGGFLAAALGAVYIVTAGSARSFNPLKKPEL